MIKFNAHIGDFKGWVVNSQNELDAMIYQVIDEATTDIYNDIMENHPVVTGKTKNSITKNVSNRELGKAVGKIEGPTDVSTFLEGGTKEHMIKPKNAKALRFTIGGNMVYSKGHKVSGIKAQHIFEQAFDKYFNSYSLERMLDVRLIKIIK